MTAALVVTGTDTGVGKTVVAAALADHLNARYWKPIQAGLEGETDSQTAARLGGLPRERILPEAHRLRLPASPHLAAAREGIAISLTRLDPPGLTAPLIIEGAGGVMVPIAPGLTFLDVFARWRHPIVLCARTTLGTINHTLLSLSALRARAIPIAGVVLVGDPEPGAEASIAEYGNASILGRLPWVRPLTRDGLRQAFPAAIPERVRAWAA